MTTEGRPAGRQPRRELLGHMLWTRHLWTERAHEVDQLPVGERLIADVFVEPAKAKKILAKRYNKTEFPPIFLPNKSGFGEGAKLQPDETIVYPGQSRHETVPREDPVDTLYNRENRQTIGSIITRSRRSTLGQVEGSNMDELFGQSRLLFGDIFTILALVDRKKASIDDVATGIVQSLLEYPFGHFSYGRVIEAIKTKRITTPIKTDIQYTDRFVRVFMKEAEKEQRVMFINGSFHEEKENLSRNALKEIMPKNLDNGSGLLTQRKRTIFLKNIRYIAEHTPPQSRADKRDTKVRQRRYLDSADGLELTNAQLLWLYENRETVTFPYYVTQSLRQTQANVEGSDRQTQMAEYMRLFGQFFDVLAISTHKISFEAGVANIIDCLNQLNFDTIFLGAVMNHILHLQYPPGEFYESGDRESAQRFIDTFLSIAPREKRDEFATAIDRRRYNKYMSDMSINSTRALAEQLIGGITTVSGRPYRGDSFN